MTAMVPGIYKEGKIELLETPVGVRDGRVQVLLLPEEEPKPAPRYLVRGKYNGDTPPEAFEEAEFHGEPELDPLATTRPRSRSPALSSPPHTDSGR